MVLLRKSDKQKLSKARVPAEPRGWGRLPFPSAALPSVSMFLSGTRLIWWCLFYFSFSFLKKGNKRGDHQFRGQTHIVLLAWQPPSAVQVDAKGNVATILEASALVGLAWPRVCVKLDTNNGGFPVDFT